MPKDSGVALVAMSRKHSCFGNAKLFTFSGHADLQNVKSVTLILLCSSCYLCSAPFNLKQWVSLILGYRLETLY